MTERLRSPRLLATALVVILIAFGMIVLDAPRWLELSIMIAVGLAGGIWLRPSRDPRPSTKRDLEVLAVVGRMYLDALDDDPANEFLTLPASLLVTEVREAVERQEADQAGSRTGRVATA